MASTLKSTTLAKALATVVGLCGAGLLVLAGRKLYHVLDSTRAWWELLLHGGLSIIGAILIVIVFRAFARPTSTILRLSLASCCSVC